MRRFDARDITKLDTTNVDEDSEDRRKMSGFVRLIQPILNKLVNYLGQNSNKKLVVAASATLGPTFIKEINGYKSLADTILAKLRSRPAMADLQYFVVTYSGVSKEQKQKRGQTKRVAESYLQSWYSPFKYHLLGSSSKSLSHSSSAGNMSSSDDSIPFNTDLSDEEKKELQKFFDKLKSKPLRECMKVLNDHGMEFPFALIVMADSVYNTTHAGLLTKNAGSMDYNRSMCTVGFDPVARTSMMNLSLWASAAFNNPNSAWIQTDLNFGGISKGLKLDSYNTTGDPKQALKFSVGNSVGTAVVTATTPKSMHMCLAQKTFDITGRFHQVSDPVSHLENGERLATHFGISDSVHSHSYGSRDTHHSPLYSTNTQSFYTQYCCLDSLTVFPGQKEWVFKGLNPAGYGPDTTQVRKGDKFFFPSVQIGNLVGAVNAMIPGSGSF